MSESAKKIEHLEPIEGDPENRKVCFCHSVHLKELISAIKDKGCHTLEAIKSETCASTGCGGCEYEVNEILEETLKKLP